MSTLLFLVLSLATGVMPADPAERAARRDGEHCPAAYEHSGARVHNLLSSPLLPQLRAQFNFGTASPSDVQLLTNQRDRDTCRALWEALHASGTDLSGGDRVTFYRSGDTFFVPISRSRRPGRPGAVQLDGFSSLDVYDSAFRLVGRFGA